MKLHLNGGRKEREREKKAVRGGRKISITEPREKVWTS
jgi:hypothetical protein